MTKRAAREVSIALLDRVGIATPAERMKAYPHELSGGIAQRVMVAMAVALEPEVLLADEPTSSLDVTVQAQVLELLGSLVAETEMAMVLITHNLAVAVGLADRIAVMYAGRIVELGPARDVFAAPKHPYTAGLLAGDPRHHDPRGPPAGHQGSAAEHAAPADRVRLPSTVPPGRRPLQGGGAAVRGDLPRALERMLPRRRGRAMTAGDVLLEAVNVVKHFPLNDKIFGSSGVIHAVDDVSLALHEGEVLGVVGESGCGKSTLSNLFMMLEEPTSGSVLYRGTDISTFTDTETHAFRQDVQMVFQDTLGSLNPRMTINDILTEPYTLHRDVLPKDRWDDRVRELLALVGLDPNHANRYPHQFSGGQRQRICIARALALTRRSWCATSPCRRSMSRCRPRSSTC